jgi:hypothetical protein
MTQQRKKAELRRTRLFTHLWLSEKLPYAPQAKQVLWWDDAAEGQVGLCVQVGSHTKTFRNQIKLHGKWITYTLGRFPEMGLAQARDRAYEDRKSAEAPKRLSGGWGPCGAGPTRRTL